jgi:hypothetical protein
VASALRPGYAPRVRTLVLSLILGAASINLADQASTIGARNVSALTMLQIIARRVRWLGLRDCRTIYSIAEARAENGDK